jgi:hypothetical protein
MIVINVDQPPPYIRDSASGKIFRVRSSTLQAASPRDHSVVRYIYTLTDSTRMPVFSHTKVCVHGSDYSEPYRQIKYVYMNVINVDQLSQRRRIDAARVLWKNFRVRSSTLRPATVHETRPVNRGATVSDSGQAERVNRQLVYHTQ